MIAETIKLVRWLTGPAKRSYWWPGKARKSYDCAGVLLISLASVSDETRYRLLKRYQSYHIQPLSNSARPSDAGLERKDTWLSITYRALVFLIRTLRLGHQLYYKNISWAQHLCECQGIARAQQALMLGVPFYHLGSLRGSSYKDLRDFDRLVSSINHRRYEIWFIVRDRQVAYVPSTLAWPKEPLSVAEIERLARHRSSPQARVSGLKHLAIPPGKIRLMTYNVHSCVGLDGRLSVRRIAEVLERYSPHFVALQELDLNCKRTELRDQLGELSRLWPSTPFFFPAMQKDQGQYGIGCLSRLDVISSSGYDLPYHLGLGSGEPRVAILTKLKCPSGVELSIVNTHLGLTKSERLAQIKGIEEVLESIKGPYILMGDLNCSPNSKEVLRLLQHMKAVSRRAQKTWFGSYPVRTLDYIFISKALAKKRRESYVPIEPLTIKASDHLPVIVDIEMP